MKKLAAIAIAIAPGTALAHPGHGALSDPILHLLGEPVHALPLLAAIVVAAGLVLARRVQKQKAGE